MAMEPVGPVVVGVDGSAGSLAALELAADEAAARVTPLVVVCAGERDVAVAQAVAEHPALSVTGQLVQGDPADAILEASRGADLVVLGPRRGDRSAPSVELRVLSRVRVPLIVFRPFDAPAEGALPRPVLVGVVGEPSDDLVAFAFAEAALRGTALHALFVDADGAAATDQLQPDALTIWSEKYPEVVVSSSIRRGVDAAVALAAASRSAHLVVVEAGAVATGLVHLAGCPVAVVPVSSHD
ncbi:MAG: hypothetical protein ACM30G_16585 [Micromonosporaceae bacterium]